MSDWHCQHCGEDCISLGYLSSHLLSIHHADEDEVAKWAMKFPREDATPLVHRRPTAGRWVAGGDAELFGAAGRFRMWVMLNGDRVYRTEVPADKTYDGFCRFLKPLFYMPGWHFSIDQFEYVLVEKRTGNKDVAVPFFDEGSYQTMVRKLMEVTTNWRHTIIQIRTVSMQTLFSPVKHELTYL